MLSFSDSESDGSFQAKSDKSSSSSSSSSDSTQPERFFHPFHEDTWDNEDSSPGVWEPRTLAELRMCRLSAHIRQKPRWWEKMRDEAIRSKWVQEAKEQQADQPPWEKLTDNMIAYVISELEGYAELRDEATGIEVGPCERTYVSGTLIPADVTEALRLAVKPLEDVPDEEKDWHPGSEDRVLDLVHPSTCPLIFGETWGTDEDGKLGVFSAPDAEDMNVAEIFLSKRFQWLPSDFAVDESGRVTLSSPYINNISPQHHLTLIPVIERVMQGAVPLWEHVLSALDGNRDPVPARVPQSSNIGAIPCIWPSDEPYPKLGEEAEYNQDPDAWMINRMMSESLILPDSGPEYTGSLHGHSNKTVSLSGTKIQVIVKLANIVLTPQKPVYPGGVWHCEGMATDSIVSTFIYYYESENIEPCQLNFRMATKAPGYHCQDDRTCTKILYGIEQNRACVQEIGGFQTQTGQCIAFPNLYQHRVSPFSLSDPTKPGVRKILVFFLVDPTFSILSASNVPPQQFRNVQHMLRSQGPSSRLSLLPVELLDIIARFIPGVKSRAEAEDIREELMRERSLIIKTVNTQFFEREFNMCEH
ncbi:hypothetical protein C8J57DRAFT_1119396 [Mycena rebaudengoi]|nr:hypothetical protein C8J57DRAFT_1119396 [Mycena rebaudengoi]